MDLSFLWNSVLFSDCLISKRENEKHAQMQHLNGLYGNCIMKEFVSMVIREVPHKEFIEKGEKKEACGHHVGRLCIFCEHNSRRGNWLDNVESRAIQLQI